MWLWSKNGLAAICSIGELHMKDMDLVEVKPRVKKTMWLSLYPNGVVWFCTEDSKVGDDCLARVKVEIDCEEGEGL